MADGVTVDNGTLTDFDVSTDEAAGGKHVQRVKLAMSADGSETHVQADANGLLVNPGAGVVGGVKITDGTDVADVLDLANSNPLTVAIVNGAGDQVTSFAGSGGTSSTDDADFTAGSTAGTPIIGVYESSPTNVTDGDMGIVGINQTRHMRVEVASSTLDVAHDAADSGNPVKTGAKAHSALPTAVANNDRTNNVSDLFGRLLVAHIAPEMAAHKHKVYTTTQTGTDVWTPAGGKRIAVTSLVIGTRGTNAGRITLWFGDNADTTFTQDTDQVLFDADFAPSANGTPGAIYCPATPVFCTTADRELHITTTNNLNCSVTVEGYEF